VGAEEGKEEQEALVPHFFSASGKQRSSACSRGIVFRVPKKTGAGVLIVSNQEGQFTVGLYFSLAGHIDILVIY
jgi:hypothetical protein